MTLKINDTKTISTTPSRGDTFGKRKFFSFSLASNAQFFQPKLTINQPNDVYEKEADAVAEKVVNGPGEELIQHKKSPLQIHKKCAKCQEEEEQIQKKESETNNDDLSYPILQRKCLTCDDEEELQRKASSAKGSALEAPYIVNQAINTSGQPLDYHTKTFMEDRFGYDFNNISIHTGSLATKSAQAINALAYTSGNSIVFNQGQYAPQTEFGKKLLAHELTHVVQQSAAPLSRHVQRKEIAQGTMIEGEDSGDHVADEVNIVRPATDMNFARVGTVPYSFRADKDLPSPKKDEPNHPLMIWAIQKVFNLSESESADIVSSGSLVWYQDGATDYKEGDVVNFQLTASTISTWMSLLSAEGKIDHDATKIFDVIISLQGELTDRDYSFMLLWLEKNGVELRSLTAFQNLTPENLSRIKALIQEFKDNKYALLEASDLFDSYLFTEDPVRDSRFDELKDLLFTRDAKSITAEEETEILKLFQDKALTTAFVALEESKNISKREHERYLNDPAALDELVSIVNSYALDIPNMELRIKEFVKFTDSILQLPEALRQDYPGQMKFYDIQKVVSVYKSTNSITELFKTYPNGVTEILSLLSIQNLSRAMAETIAYSFYRYVQSSPEELKSQHNLPKELNHPLFIKFREKFPGFQNISFQEIQDGCLEIVHEQQPELLSLEKIIRREVIDNHPVLNDISMNFSLMHEPAQTKSQIMQNLKDKPVKADETKARLQANPELIWEFEPLLQYILIKENLTNTHPIHKVIHKKIDAVADRKFWKSMGLAALGIVFGVIGSIFTGGAGASVAIALIANTTSAIVSVYDLMDTYADYKLHSDAHGATLKVPFTNEQSSLSVVLALAGLVFDVKDVLQSLDAAGKALGKAGKTVDESTQADIEISSSLSNAKNMDEYATYLYSFLKGNNLLIPGITQDAFVKRLNDNFNYSQKLIQSWNTRLNIIAGLPSDIKKIVESPAFSALAFEIKESIFKIYDASSKAFAMVFKTLGNNINLLSALGFQIFKNPEIANVYAQLWKYLNELDFDKVVRYYSTVGVNNADLLPGVLNLLNIGGLLFESRLCVQVLTNRNLQQLLFNLHETPSTLRVLWNDFIGKYPGNDGAGFATYLTKESSHKDLLKMEEVSNPAPKAIGFKLHTGLFTDPLGNLATPKALEGFEADLRKLKEALNDAANIDEVIDAKYLDDYDIEVPIGAHTFRRNRHTGGWCRFSDPKCISDLRTQEELSNAVEAAKQKAALEKAWKTPESGPRYAPAQKNLKASEKTMKAIVAKASKLSTVEPDDFFPHLNNFGSSMRDTKMRNKIIEGLKSDSNFEVAWFLVVRVSSGQVILPFLSKLSLEQIAHLKTTFSPLKDTEVQFVRDLAYIVEHIDGSGDEITALLIESGGREMTKVIKAIQRLGKERYTLEQIRKSLEFEANLRAALVGNKGEEVAEVVWGKAFIGVDDTGTIKLKLDLFTIEKPADLAYAYIKPRQEAIVDLVFDDEVTPVINKEAFDLIFSMIDDADLGGNTIVRNSIIGELWTAIKVKQLERLGFTKVIREVHVSKKKRNGEPNTDEGGYIKLDAVAINEETGEMIYLEFKSSDTASFTANQKEIYKLLAQGKTKLLTPWGGRAEAAFGSRFENFVAMPVTKQTPSMEFSIDNSPKQIPDAESDLNRIEDQSAVTSD